MNGRPPKLKRAEGSLGDLRALFCALLLLPLYAVPEKGAPDSGNIGMDAPPPPILESLTRLGTLGGLERRVVGPLPVVGGRVAERTPHAFTPPQPMGPVLRRAALAEFQQWRLEGG